MKNSILLISFLILSITNITISFALAEGGGFGNNGEDIGLAIFDACNLDEKCTSDFYNQLEKATSKQDYERIADEIKAKAGQQAF
jgi:hypothetical protein